MPLVTGYDGLITIGAGPVTVNRVRTWSHSSERDVTEVGPWVGNSAKETTIGGKLGTLELEGDIPEGGDPGIQDILDAYENGTNDQFVVTCEDGYTITYATPSYTAFNIEVDAAETQVWSATIQGAYTVSQDT